MKLSFIVPIYGVEPYLRKCIDSLLHQDYRDYEIILVDDGGNDGCPVICDEYASKYDNIQVIHCENGGLSAARNSGTDAAKGEFLCFVDSDDYWAENMLGGLMNQIERDNLDVLRFRWQNVRETGEAFKPYKEDNFADFSSHPLSGREYLNQRMGIQCYAWSFIVKRELCKKEKFTEGILFEDTDWTPRMLECAGCVAGTDIFVYNYLWRENGITLSRYPEKNKREVENKISLIERLKERGNTEWYRGMISALMVSVIGMLSEELYYERKKYLKTVKTLDVFPLSMKGLNTKTRRKARLINISPCVAVWALHIKNR